MAKKSKYIPIVIAASAVGAFFLLTRKANASPSFPVPGDVPTPLPSPSPSPGGGGGSTVKIAPSAAFPYATVAQAKIAENGEATAAHARYFAAAAEAMQANGESGTPSQAARDAARDELNIPADIGTATWIANTAFARLYTVGKIPAASKRTAGWQPYVDSWIRMFDYAKTQLWV